MHRELIRLLHSALPDYGAPECVNHPAITAGSPGRRNAITLPLGPSTPDPGHAHAVRLDG